MRLLTPALLASAAALAAQAARQQVIDLPAQALTYAIIGGADAALFTIDPATGALGAGFGDTRYPILGTLPPAFRAFLRDLSMSPPGLH